MEMKSQAALMASAALLTYVLESAHPSTSSQKNTDNRPDERIQRGYTQLAQGIA